MTANENDDAKLPSNGRLISAGMAAAGLFGLLLNHFTIGKMGTGHLMLLALCPVATAIGIGGVVEPKILWSVGKHGTHLPVKYKIIGGVLGGVGLLVTLALVFLVYQLGPA